MKAQFTTLKVIGGLFVGGMMLNAHAAPELYGYASLGIAANHKKQPTRQPMSVHQQQTAPICIAADHALALEGLKS